MTEATQESEQVVLEYAELWSKQEYDKISEVVTDSFVLRDSTIPAGEVKGREELAEWIRQFTSAFPDFTVDIRKILASDDLVMAEATYTMTHEGEFEDLPPTGRSVEVDAMAAFRIEDGKIAEHREYHDQQEMYEQLGVVDE